MCNRQSKLLKGESFDGRESCRGSVLRPSVSKSFSFGGYTRGMLSRGDSVTSTHSAGARLMKQGSRSILYDIYPFVNPFFTRVSFMLRDTSIN